ncbi:MAG: WGR domain-containing protein [Deltaproteobacteria bacterium]|nr:WGR domain-containing protein [Deltaproteobacteria bacterium]
MSVIREIELFFQEGSSDKVYTAMIVKDGGGDVYTVKVAWGRRGSTLNTGAKAVKVALAVAHKKFDSLVREKTNKGYQPITAEVKPAAVAPPVGEGSGSKAPRARARVGPAAQLLEPIEDHELDKFLADDTMIAQQKIDGMRVLTTIGDELIVTNRDGQLTTKVDMRKLAGLEYLPHGTVVDGELLEDGYWLFDILQWGEEDIRDRGYLERWELLDNEAEPALSGDIRIVPIAKGKRAKQALHDKLRAAGAEGIVFKRRDAPYTAGRGATQRKHKFIKSCDVIVIENVGNAYLMAVYDGKKLFEVGKVFAGTTNASRKALDAALGRGEKPICEVRYLYASDDHQLFQPVFVRTRDDKPAKQCLRGQLLTTCRDVVA